MLFVWIAVSHRFPLDERRGGDRVLSGPSLATGLLVIRPRTKRPAGSDNQQVLAWCKLPGPSTVDGVKAFGCGARSSASVSAAAPLCLQVDDAPLAGRDDDNRRVLHERLEQRRLDGVGTRDRP